MLVLALWQIAGDGRVLSFAGCRAGGVIRVSQADQHRRGAEPRARRGFAAAGRDRARCPTPSAPCWPRTSSPRTACPRSTIRAWTATRCGRPTSSTRRRRRRPGCSSPRPSPPGMSPLSRSRPGEAARIMTGAPIPQGADTVVQSEITSEEDGLRARLRAGQAGQEHPPRRRRRRWPATGCSRPGTRARPGGDRPARQPRPSAGVRSTGGRGWPSSPRAASWWRSTSRSGPGRSATPTATRCGPCAGNSASRPRRLGIVPDDYEATREAIRGRAGVRRAAHFGRGLGRASSTSSRTCRTNWAWSGGCGASP